MKRENITTVLMILVTISAGVFLATAHAAADAKIEKLWRAKCASCHAKDGTGKTKKGEEMGVADMTTAEWQKKFTDEKIKEATREGIKREESGKKKEMDPYKDKIKPEEINGLTKFMRDLGKK